MQLTAEKLSDLVSSLRTNVARGMEKRKDPRVGLRARVQLLLVGRHEPVDVWVRDVGVAGIGLLSPIQLQAGTGFSLSFWDEDGNATFVKCGVCHCRKMGSEQFQIGAKFADDSFLAKSRRRQD
jgi:hypothetical protein